MRTKVWLYPGMAHSTDFPRYHSGQAGQAGAWHFVTLPKKQSADITARFGAMKRGWGSLPVLVTIGKTSWKTSIFPDKKAGAYLLPIKTEVRKKEKIKNGDTVSFFMRVGV